MKHFRLLVAWPAVITAHAAAFDTVINLPPSTVVPKIQSNTQINLLDGGELPNLDYASSVSNVEINILGGIVPGNLNAISADRLNIRGGVGTGPSNTSIGLARVTEISGGRFPVLSRNGPVAASMTGGEVERFSIGDRNGEPGAATLAQSGGTIQSLSVDRGATATVAGGRLGRVEVSGTTVFGVSPALLQLVGGEFLLNGQPAAGRVGVEEDDVLTGVLADGSSLVLAGRSDGIGTGDFAASGSLELIEVAVPVAGPPLVDLAVDPVPNGLRPGQTLVAYAGDDLGDAFHAIDADIRLGAASLGNYSKLVSGTLTVDGGSVGHSLAALAGASVLLRDGSIESELLVSGGSHLSVLGGTALGSTAVADSTVAVDGGALGSLTLSGSLGGMFAGKVSHISLGDSSFEVAGGFVETLSSNGDAVAEITGGHVRRISNRATTRVSGGRIGGIEALNGQNAPVEMHGAFELDGQPISGSVALAPGEVLTGVLTDGTPVAFSSLLGDGQFQPTLPFELIDSPVAAVVPGVINAPIDAIPSGIREGQILVIAPGADTGTDFVSHGGVLNVAGGTLGREAVAIGGLVNISAGNVGSEVDPGRTPAFVATDEAVVIVSGGQIGDSPFGNNSGSTAILNRSSMIVIDGQVLNPVELSSGSRLDALGGYVRSIRPSDGATVRLAGDVVVDQIDSRFPRSAPTTDTVRVVFDGGTTDFASLNGALVEVSGGTIDRLIVTDLTVDTETVDGSASIYGGQVREAIAGGRGDILVTGGALVDKLAANSEGVAVLRGATIGSVEASSDGRVDVESGVVSEDIRVVGGTVDLLSGHVLNGTPSQPFARTNRVEGAGLFNLYGGSVRGGFFVEEGSFGRAGARVEAFGGVFGRGVLVEESATMRLHGSEFMLNGEPVTGQVDPTEDYILTGTLTDGSVFVLSSAGNDQFGAGTLHLVEASIPSADGVIDAPADPAPHGLRLGQTLNVSAGAELGDHFAAVGATLDMSGGSIGYGFELVDSTATLTGGSIGNQALLYGGSTFSIAGGFIGDFLVALDDATVNLTGGKLGEEAEFRAGSHLVVTGGATSPELTLGGDAIVSGGIIGRGLITEFGSSLELLGGEFRLDGETVIGPVNLAFGQVLTGVLADGTPFLFGNRDSVHRGQVQLTEAPLPGVTASVINAPSDAVPLGLREGQTLNLGAGSETAADFTAIGGTLNVEGGTVGERLEAIATRVEIRSGEVGADAHIFDGSDMIIRGGTVADHLAIAAGASASMVDGEMGIVLLAEGATLNLAGGTFNGTSGDLFTQDFWSPVGSTINLYGLAFSQGDNDLTAGLSLGESVVVTDNRTDLVGILSDGSPIDLPTGGRGRIIANGLVTITKLLQGDFNHDGVVDASDYTVWRDTEGDTVLIGSGADHDFDGVITWGDYEVWISNFGATVASALAGGVSAVPEPAAIVLGTMLLLTALQRRRQR